MSILIPLSSIVDSPYQTRTRYDEAAVEALAQSVARSGLMQPPVGRLVNSDGTGLGLNVTTMAAYGGHGGLMHTWRVELAFGHTRLRAFRLLAEREAAEGGLQEPALLPRFASMAVELRPLSDDEMEAAAWEENAKRRDLDPVDRAAAIAARIARHGWTHEQAAEALGMTRSNVSNILRWYEALRAGGPVGEAALDAVRDGRLSEAKARALSAAFLAAAEHPDVYADLAASQAARVASGEVRSDLLDSLAGQLESALAADTADEVREAATGLADLVREIAEERAEAERREREPRMFEDAPAPGPARITQADATAALNRLWATYYSADPWCTDAALVRTADAELVEETVDTLAGALGELETLLVLVAAAPGVTLEPSGPSGTDRLVECVEEDLARYQTELRRREREPAEVSADTSPAPTADDTPVLVPYSYGGRSERMWGRTTVEVVSLGSLDEGGRTYHLVHSVVHVRDDGSLAQSPKFCVVRDDGLLVASSRETTGQAWARLRVVLDAADGAFDAPSAPTVNSPDVAAPTLQPEPHGVPGPNAEPDVAVPPTIEESAAPSAWPVPVLDGVLVDLEKRTKKLLVEVDAAHLAPLTRPEGIQEDSWGNPITSISEGYKKPTILVWVRMRIRFEANLVCAMALTDAQVDDVDAFLVEAWGTPGPVAPRRLETQHGSRAISNWRSMLRTLDVVPMDDRARRIYRQCEVRTLLATCYDTVRAEMEKRERAAARAEEKAAAAEVSADTSPEAPPEPSVEPPAERSADEKLAAVLAGDVEPLRAMPDVQLRRARDAAFLQGAGSEVGEAIRQEMVRRDVEWDAPSPEYGRPDGAAAVEGEENLDVAGLKTSEVYGRYVAEIADRVYDGPAGAELKRRREIGGEPYDHVCPTCGAVAGQHCQQRGGKVSSDVHEARWDAADAALAAAGDGAATAEPRPEAVAS